jgi:DNA-binding CsgD family transcriptional regulator
MAMKHLALSRAQKTLLIDILDICTSIANTADLDKLIDGPLRELLHYEIALCGTGVSLEKGCYVHKFHNHGYPLEYFYEIQGPDGTVSSPLMTRWRKTHQPVYFQSGRDDPEFPADWVAIVNKYNLRNIISGANVDRSSLVSNYFIFARMQEEVGPMQASLLKMLTPSLSLALMRALKSVECEKIKFAGSIHDIFSRKEREIFQQIYEGKSDYELIDILQMSEDDLYEQIRAVMKKLKVKSYAQAVGRAMEIGLIPSNII